jgi:hypothetical protein
LTKDKTKKTKVKRKDQKDNGQKKRPKIQWSKEKTKNTMVKRKDQKNNGQKIVFLVLSFDHCIFGLFF